MKLHLKRVVGESLRAPTFSGVGLAVRAGLIALFFVICHALGWREHTTFLSGTPAGADVNASTVLGLIYMAGYFGLVIATPILLIAAVLLWAWERRSCRS